MRKASTRLPEQGTQTPSPAPDLIPAETKNLTENSHGDWYSKRGHFSITNLGLTRVDSFTLQRAAGHSNIATTRKYVHPTPPTTKGAFQKKVRNVRRDVVRLASKSQVWW